MKPIPIQEAKNIAQKFGYDQVVIVARKVSEDGGEHVTTYGTDKVHCEVAARIGTTLKHHLMQWPSSLKDTRLRVLGLGRDIDNTQALSLTLSRVPTDDDIRTLHDFLNPNS